MEERKISDSLQRVDSNILDWETNSTTVNESNHTGMSSCGIMSCTMIFLSLIIAIVVLVGNAIVIWLLGFQMCRNAFSIYILNLAGADFLFIGFQIGYCFYIIFDIYTIPIKLPLFFIVMLNFAYLCGLSILSAVSIERCLCVMRPFWYRCQLPRHTSAVICTMLWVLSLVLSLSEGKECGFLPGTNISDWCKTIDLIITSWLIVLFVVLLVSSLALVITIFCGLYRIPVTRLYVVIVFTVLFFLLFGLPYGIYLFLLVWAETFYYVFPCGFLPVTIFLSCINSCANPIIYFLVGSVRHHRFQRKSLKLLLQQARQDTPETEEYVEMGSLGRSREVNSLQGTESCFD